MSPGSSPKHTVVSVALITPAVNNWFSANVIEVTTGVPGQSGSVALTDIVAVAAGLPRSGITTENVLLVPIEVQPIVPGTEYSKVVEAFKVVTAPITNSTVEDGQYELAVPDVVIVTLGVSDTNNVNSGDALEQADGSITPPNNGRS